MYRLVEIEINEGKTKYNTNPKDVLSYSADNVVNGDTLGETVRTRKYNYYANDVNPVTMKRPTVQSKGY